MEKRQRAKENYQLTEDDLVLVRIMKSKDFPKDLVYRTLSEQFIPATVDNPLKQVINYVKYDIDYFKEPGILPADTEYGDIETEENIKDI